LANRKIEEKLERLNELRAQPRPEAIAALRKALADRSNVVVAKAAKLAAELELSEATPDLAAALQARFRQLFIVLT
jgi:hypothetical protein